MPEEIPFTAAAQGLLDLALPPGSPPEAETAVRRLIEVTAVLARRCAQLQEALDSRIVIEQAKGVLSERFHLEPDQAFEVLRRGSRSNRLPLRDLAAQVISSERTPWEVAAQVDGAAVPRRFARVSAR